MWLNKAAAGEFRPAMSKLGAFYTASLGTDDKKEAAYWYLKAAKGGDAHAQHNVGVFYERGRGVEKDLDVAASWYCRAAEQGIPTAKEAVQRLFPDSKLSKLA